MKKDSCNALIRLIKAPDHPEQYKELILNQDDLKYLIGHLMMVDADLDEVLLKSFETKEVTPQMLYQKLIELQHKLGYSQLSEQLVGVIWSRYYQTQDESIHTEIKDCFLELEQDCFFHLLGGLPVLLGRNELTPQELISWLHGIKSKIGNDLINRGYYDAIHSFCHAFPRAGLDALVIFIQSDQYDQDIASSATFLIALKESMAAHPKIHSALGLFESELENSNNVNRRVIYLRAWATCCIDTSFQKIKVKLTNLMNKSDLERSEAFNCIRRIIGNSSIERSLLVKDSVEWLIGNIAFATSDNAKNNITTLTRVLCEKYWEVISEGDILKLIIGVQPIEKTNQDTWHHLSDLLLFLLRFHISLFMTVFSSLVTVNPKGLYNQFQTSDDFTYLLSEMASKDVGELALDAIFGKSIPMIELGFFLLDKLGTGQNPTAYFQAKSDTSVEVSLLAFRMRTVHSRYSVLFLIALANAFENRDREIQELIGQEILYQSKNSPRLFLGRFKAHGMSNCLIASSVAQADIYFGNLQKCYKSPLTCMELPGLSRAARLKAKRDGIKMSKQVDQHSVFGSVFPKSYALYGNAAQIFCEGKLDQITKMQEFSAEAEIPRLEVIDPEECQMFRAQAFERISFLIEGMETNEP